mgnify:CR=1 FL=1
MRSLFVLILLSFISCLSAKAEILFEGYYKVTQFKQHIGFLVLRHEIEEKTNNFKSTSFIKLAKGGFDLTESYVAASTSELAPVSIKYLAAGKSKTKTTDVTFKKEKKAVKMVGSTIEDGKKIKINEVVPPGIFLSSALYYIMLRSKDGLKTGSVFDFKAITEEGPVVMDGTVAVDKKMVTQDTLQLLSVTNKFAGPEYSNLITTKGEIISSFTPATSIESVLVKNKEEAIEGITIKPGTLEQIFKNKPEGKINVLQTKGK